MGGSSASNSLRSSDMVSMECFTVMIDGGSIDCFWAGGLVEEEGLIFSSVVMLSSCTGSI